MKRIILLIAVIGIALQVHAQKDEKITYEAVKQQCAGLPLEKRARMSVTRFSITTRTNDPAVEQNANSNNTLKALSILAGRSNAPRADEIPLTLADNMTTMLTNALQGVNCFRVLETQKNNGDLTQEIDAGNNGYSGKKVPKAGKQLGPQIVATGELIEYSVKAKGLNVMGVGANKKLVKIGFNIKLINPETRDIISSKVFRVQSKTGNSVSVLGLVSTDNSDPAVAAVMEDGVIHAVEYLSHVRDSLNITVDNIPGNSSNAVDGNEIDITLNNATFDSFDAFTTIVSAVPGFKTMDKDFTSGVGTFTVMSGGTTDAFLEGLKKRMGSKYQITGYGSGKIELKAK